MIKGGFKRYKKTDEIVVAHPRRFKKVACSYCKSKFFVKNKVAKQLGRGDFIHCGSAVCANAYHMKIRHDCRARRKAKEPQRIKDERYVDSYTRSESEMADFSKKRADEEQRLKRDAASWYFGPGDVFYEGIVAPILAERERDEQWKNKR